MPKKEALLKKLQRKPAPNNFTKRELDTLMRQCGCEECPGGRGSSIRYYHVEKKRVVTFDQPHPGNELHRYQIDKVIEFLISIGEISNN